MIFMNDAIKYEIDRIWKEYQIQGFRLFCEGVELTGDSFEDWYANNKSICMNPEATVTNANGAVVFIRCAIITFELYDGDLLVTNSNNASKYSPAHYQIPVIYTSNTQLDELIEYIISRTKFEVSTSYLGLR